MEFIGDGEYDVEVFDGQDVSLPSIDPGQFAGATAIVAVPISTRVVEQGFLAAVIADVAMAAKRGSAAIGNSRQRLTLSAREVAEIARVVADDLGDSAIGAILASGMAHGRAHDYSSVGVVLGLEGVRFSRSRGLGVSLMKFLATCV